MIQSIEIQRLRGIREGKVEGLAPLTVLVGPSGAGKSTVLDALLILFSRSPGDAVGRVIRRRAELTQGAPWLFHRRLPGARIRGVAELTGQREAELSWSSRSQIDMPGVDIRWVRQVTTLCAMAGKTFTTRTAVAPSNQYLFDADYQDGAQQAWSHEQAFLVEPRAGANHASLTLVYTAAATAG
ncbi:MAG TPA: AAA family ATPase [Byssovorax sp.]|jgi:energy-coupling factor transporter ATP-binding protein EcfA2